nr:hypothetical protein [Candidatus Kapabacteria bacterium]
MGTTGRENRKKATPPLCKSGTAPHVAAKQKPGGAAVPAVDAEPREPLIPPHVARFLASIPMTPDPVEWILGFRAALQELLGDVDRIAMEVNAYCRVNTGRPHPVIFQVGMHRAFRDSRPENTIELWQWDEIGHAGQFLRRLQRAGHDMGAYHEPIGMDYEYRDAGYLASMLLFRERYRPGISDRTL